MIMKSEKFHDSLLFKKNKQKITFFSMIKSYLGFTVCWKDLSSFERFERSEISKQMVFTESVSDIFEKKVVDFFNGENNS